jgi:hypothetical protein
LEAGSVPPNLNFLQLDFVKPPSGFHPVTWERVKLDEESKEYVIASTSRNNNKVESNYSSYEGECLVIVWVVIQFRPYLYATKFTLYINHQPIKCLMTNNKFTGKLAHWALILQEYEFKVIHRPGITH